MRWNSTLRSVLFRTYSIDIWMERLKKVLHPTSTRQGPWTALMICLAYICCSLLGRYKQIKGEGYWCQCKSCGKKNKAYRHKRGYQRVFIKSFEAWSTISKCFTHISYLKRPQFRWFFMGLTHAVQDHARHHAFLSKAVFASNVWGGYVQQGWPHLYKSRVCITE